MKFFLLVCTLAIASAAVAVAAPASELAPVSGPVGGLPKGVTVPGAK